eukprot:scaffold408_cov388-Prasinococcus_capsulatus_cf.AAC.22
MDHHLTIAGDEALRSQPCTLGPLVDQIIVLSFKRSVALAQIVDAGLQLPVCELDVEVYRP